VTAFAGPHAETRYAGYPPDTAMMMWQSAWNTDRANAAVWLCGLKGVTLMQAEAMARHLVEEHWPTIVRIAAALVVCKGNPPPGALRAEL
jgi:hypothetical protein